METKIVGDPRLQLPGPIPAQYFLGSQPNLGSVYHAPLNGCNTLLLSRYRGSIKYDDDDIEDDYPGSEEDFDDVDEFESFDHDDDDDDVNDYDDDDDNDINVRKRNK